MSVRPIRDGAGYMDFNTKDGRRFSVVHGYLLPALERQNLTLLTGTRVEALSFQGRSLHRSSAAGLAQSVMRSRPNRKRCCAREWSSFPACSCSRVSAMPRSFAATASRS